MCTFTMLVVTKNPQGTGVKVYILRTHRTRDLSPILMVFLVSWIANHYEPVHHLQLVHGKILCYRVNNLCSRLERVMLFATLCV